MGLLEPHAQGVNRLQNVIVEIAVEPFALGERPAQVRFAIPQFLFGELVPRDIAKHRIGLDLPARQHYRRPNDDDIQLGAVFASANAFDFVFCYGVLQHTPAPAS